jgi:hypothetical protein
MKRLETTFGSREPVRRMILGARNSGWLHKSRNAFLKQTQEKLAHLEWFSFIPIIGGMNRRQNLQFTDNIENLCE